MFNGTGDILAGEQGTFSFGDFRTYTTVPDNGERVVELLRKIRAANPGKRLLLVLDNAPYNHSDVVTQAAKSLRIELLYLPTYSPNLNLIERFWKFLKRKVARNRYYTTFAEFRSAVQKILNNIASYDDELASLMTERFQLFTTT